MTAFIKTANGTLLNANAITELHLDYHTPADKLRDHASLYAGNQFVGAPSPGASARGLLSDLAVRITARPGVYSIVNGRITHRFLTEDAGAFRTVIYPVSGTNTD